MNPHFFTAPFYFAFIWFRVQGSRFRVEVRRFAPIFVNGDARRLEDRSQVSDVSQSPSLIPNP